jgi:predicted DNA-binding transcriptional regulator AlpA
VSPLNAANRAFTLILEGPDPTTPANLDRLFEAGCDDATFGARDGVFVAEFDRESPSLGQALAEALTTIEATIPGLRVVRVEPEELVTAAEIASRTNRSRENVRQFFEGIRGEGDFPRPTAWLSDRTRLWHWAEVSQWFSSRLEARAETLDEDANLLGVTNALLTLRRFLTIHARERPVTARGRASLLKAWSELGAWIIEGAPARRKSKPAARPLSRFLKHLH